MLSSPENTSGFSDSRVDCAPCCRNVLLGFLKIVRNLSKGKSLLLQSSDLLLIVLLFCSQSSHLIDEGLHQLSLSLSLSFSLSPLSRSWFTRCYPNARSPTSGAPLPCQKEICQQSLAYALSKAVKRSVTVRQESGASVIHAVQQTTQSKKHL